MREWRNTFHTNFCRIDQLGDDLICLVVTARFREGLLISGFQLLQVQGVVWTSSSGSDLNKKLKQKMVNKQKKKKVVTEVA